MEQLDRLPWGMAVLLALTVGLAPFYPRPHLIEKLQMLFSGKLTRPLDIFDMAMHGLPWALLGLKCLRALLTRGT